MKKVLFITLLAILLSQIAIVTTGCETAIESEAKEKVEVENVVEDIVEDIETTEEPKDIEIKEEPVDEIECTTYNIPENNGFKSYMDYRTITNRSSKQYQLQNLYTNTNDYGLRMVGDRYCIAVGTHFNAEIGQYLDLILENGTVIPCVLSDIKADIHTDESNIVTLHNGCVSEFIVDTQSLYNKAKIMGDISHCYYEWISPVVQIVVYEQNVFNQ